MKAFRCRSNSILLNQAFQRLKVGCPQLPRDRAGFAAGDNPLHHTIGTIRVWYW